MADTYVAHDVFLSKQTGKHLFQTQNVSERNQKHFCVSDTNFVSATNVECGGKQGNKICVRHKVAATLCPHLPPLLVMCTVNLLQLIKFGHHVLYTGGVTLA